MIKGCKALIIISFLMVAASQGFAQWADISVRLDESVWATSSLTESIGGRRVEYGPEALFDGDVSTPWVEGVPGPGTGESVLILLQRPVEEIRIRNGFASSAGLYLKNNRLKTVTLSINAGLTAPGMVSETDYYQYKTIETVVIPSVPVKDIREEQELEFPLSAEEQYQLMEDAVIKFQEDEPFLFSMICSDLGVDEENTGIYMYLREVVEYYGFFALRLTIDDVYPGTLYDDTCISEITFVSGEF